MSCAERSGIVAILTCGLLATAPLHALGEESLPLATPPWVTAGSQLDARYGRSVAGAGDVNGDGYDDLIVGAFLFDAGGLDTGAAFVYLGSATGPGSTPDWTAFGETAHDELGRWVGGAGDVNGDGYDDVIVGAEAHDGARGAAYLYLGSAAGLGAAPSWSALGPEPGSLFGSSAAGAGDLNGDGYADVVIGAPSYEHSAGMFGAVFVFTGSAAGLSTTPLTLPSVWPGFGFGGSVATAGDVNGDGYDDVIVGAVSAEDTYVGEGAAFVYLGSATGPGSTPDWSAGSGQASSQFGESVATAGDVNGDGFDDVIVGAPFWDTGGGVNTAGAAFAFLGSPGGPSPSPDWMVALGIWGFMGFSVAAAGDVDGDGYGDALVGVPYLDDGEFNEGAVFLYRGGPSGLGASPAWVTHSDWPGARLGDSVAGAGDVNGDGLSDILLGAHLYGVSNTLFNPGDSTGRAYLYATTGPETEVIAVPALDPWGLALLAALLCAILVARRGARAAPAPHPIGDRVHQRP